MYRVELKEILLLTFRITPRMFLMYRVELKASLRMVSLTSCIVPNVPCGVESFQALPPPPHSRLVPNVPCGVESQRRQKRPDFC